MSDDVDGQRRHADRIAVYTSRKTIAKLAPLVERLANQLDRRSRDAASIILRAPPAPGSAPLCADTRKVLVFDASARDPLGAAVNILFWTVPLVLAALYELVVRGDPSAVAILIIPSTLMGGGLLGCMLAVVGRLRTLRHTIARCAVVPARVTAAEVCHGPPLRHSMIVTIQYPYGGLLHQASMGWGLPQIDVFGLIPVGSTLDVLVDTENPRQVFIRELYV